MQCRQETEQADEEDQPPAEQHRGCECEVEEHLVIERPALSQDRAQIPVDSRPRHEQERGDELGEIDGRGSNTPASGGNDGNQHQREEPIGRHNPDHSPPKELSRRIAVTELALGHPRHDEPADHEEDVDAASPGHRCNNPGIRRDLTVAVGEKDRSGGKEAKQLDVEDDLSLHAPEGAVGFGSPSSSAARPHAKRAPPRWGRPSTNQPACEWLGLSLSAKRCCRRRPHRCGRNRPWLRLRCELRRPCSRRSPHHVRRIVGVGFDIVGDVFGVRLDIVRLLLLRAVVAGRERSNAERNRENGNCLNDSSR